MNFKILKRKFAAARVSVRKEKTYSTKEVRHLLRLEEIVHLSDELRVSRTEIAIGKGKILKSLRDIRCEIIKKYKGVTLPSVEEQLKDV